MRLILSIKSKYADMIYDEKYNLPFPSLYDEGYHRIGCVICPFMSKREWELNKDNKMSKRRMM